MSHARTHSMSLGRLLLKTPLSAHTGYGQDGFGLVRALSDLGFDVRLRPYNVDPPLPPEVAAHLCKPLEPPFDFFLHHHDPDNLGLTEAERHLPCKKVAWTMWEFLGDSEMKDRDTLTERLSHYDQVLVYDDVSAQTLAPHLPLDKAPEKLQGGYWSEQWKQNAFERDWTGTFRYGMLGQLHARKAPWTAIQAFNQLKEEHGDDFDAELHLKTSIAGLPANLPFPGVFVYATMWPVEMVQRFYLSTNLLLAPSWGEGKCLPALEAMTSACPVAATDFGGMHEWLSKDWAYPLPYELGEHVPGMASARVSVEDLKDVMWRAYTDRGEAKGKGETAANVIPSMLDWAQVAERLRVKLLS